MVGGWTGFLTIFLVVSVICFWAEPAVEPTWLGSLLGRNLRAADEHNFWATRGKRSSFKPNGLFLSIPGKKSMKPNGLFGPLSGRSIFKQNKHWEKKPSTSFKPDHKTKWTLWNIQAINEAEKPFQFYQKVRFEPQWIR